MYWLMEVSNGRTDWRLQTDESWRQIWEDIGVLEGDRKFFQPEEVATYYALENAGAVLAGEHVTINPVGLRPKNEKEFKTSARLVRTSRPVVPSLEQLRATLMMGNDTSNNSLVLDVDGSFQLVPWTDGYPWDPRVAVRYETFAAGNDYVGPEAVEDTAFVERTYWDMLATWLLHLQTGRLNLYDDIGTTRRPQEILQELDHVISSFA